ncbi:helix-turn-helix domain-containing protein [Larkinella harenae]
MTENLIDFMTVNEKIVSLREHLKMNKNRFAKFLNIAPSTMGRIEEGMPISLDTLNKIAKTLDGVTIDWLQDESDNEIPQTVKLSDDMISSSERHEGRRLRNFLRRNDIPQKRLADQLGVSKTQVYHYLGSERFHRNVYDSLLAAFRVLLRPDITESEIFGSTRRDRDSSVQLPKVEPLQRSDFRGIPAITAEMRRSISAEAITELRQNFAPALRPDSATYIVKDMLSEEEFEKAYSLEVVASDHMEPLLPAGFKVLGLLLKPEEYGLITSGVVAIKIQGAPSLLLKKVMSNNLRTTGILELGSYNIGLGGTIQVREQDIEIMFRVPQSLGGPI